MKIKSFLILSFSILTILSCTNSATSESTSKISDTPNNDTYFNYSIDGKEFSVNANDILTSYNRFGTNDTEFKVFAGPENGPNLVLTITADMSKPSTTPNGSATAGSKLAQGSVSLQNYPEKSLTFNSYDFLQDPKPIIIPNAIVITKSENFKDGVRIITGDINVMVHGGEVEQNNSVKKEYLIKGKFRIMHEFKGIKF